jgi:maltooligosyltrehalose trehalohydrolase
MTRRLLPQGAELARENAGVRYRVWAPQRDRVVVEVQDGGGNVVREIPLRPVAGGFHEATDPQGAAGDLYKYRLAANAAFPCPASRWQPFGIDGPSLVVDPARFRWTDHAWSRPAFRDLVIYELHIGTFTGAGTFRDAIRGLPFLKELGVTAIELMPIADFPGERNWGYDGVRLYAPARCYGHPDDLRALVDSAHALGIAAILDVVYNHFGPAGNYLREFSPYYFEDTHHTPWGNAVNFGGPSSQPVRDYFVSNILYWMDEFHFDGFRLDATHQIFDDSPRHILQELAENVHARGGYIIAEDERNDARIIAPQESGGFACDAVWADDFHHSIEVGTIEASTYSEDFQGTPRELVDLIEHGWVYRGRISPRTGQPRGNECEQLAPEHFVYCISNHDQVGNRAFGERWHQMVSPETARAAAVLLCLVPYTPLLFMGQEWAASSPFLFFTDHEEALGTSIAEGRAREFRHIFEHACKQGAEIPAPQAETTFLKSKLKWEEIERPFHAGTLRLYRELLKMRKTHDAFRPVSRAQFQVALIAPEIVSVRFRGRATEWLLLCDLHGGHECSLDGDARVAAPWPVRWRLALSSNEARFAGNDERGYDPATARATFARPEAIVLEATA